jgi:hypothetical protein
MKRLVGAFGVVVALFGGAYALAQQATLSTPVTRASEDNLRVETYFATRDSGGRWEVQVSVRDSSGNEIRRVNHSGPDAAHSGATALAFVTAQMTIRASETGGNARKMDFRILGFLLDNGYLSGVTLVP